MNELKNLTNVVIGKLGKHIHKQNCSHDLKKNINYTIIIVQVRYITIEGVMVSNATFNDISVISWRSVLLVDEKEGVRRKPQTCSSN